jgi:hypothetical protein
MGEQLEAQAGTENCSRKKEKKRARAAVSTLPKGNDIMRIFSYLQTSASILHDNCMERIELSRPVEQEMLSGG